MDQNAISKRAYYVLRKNLLAVVLASLGLIFFSYGLISLSGSSSSKNDIVLEKAEESVLEEKITVDVEGAVVKPGVYTLSSEARVKDALIAASGLSADADRQWVAKSLNLAAKITDSSKIYIPKENEKVLSVQASSGVTSGTGLININSAGLSELDTLSGIGPVTAQKIIDNRPYNSVDDLLNKKVVSARVFTKIKDKISVN
jgi:competence protein ComEA